MIFIQTRSYLLKRTCEIQINKKNIKGKNTEYLYTEVWNKAPNLSHLFKYKRVLSIKFDEDICNIFLLKGFKK